MPIGTCDRCGWPALGKRLCSSCETTAPPLADRLAKRNAELSGAARQALRELDQGHPVAARALLAAVLER